MSEAEREVDEDLMTDFSVGTIYQLMEGKRLCMTCHRSDLETMEAIKQYPKLFFFSSDLQERYQNFCADFGPVNLGIVHRFCYFLHQKYTDPRLRNRAIVYYTEEDPAVRTNTVFLLGCYMMLCHGLSAEEAYRPFECLHPYPWLGFRDATYCEPTFTLDILDCFQGLQAALHVGWFDLETFDLSDYEFWDHPLNGDLHVLTPKFVAFKGPSATKQEIAPGFFTFEPAEYCQILKDLNVTAIVRLNEPDAYDKGVFEAHGFNFYDLYFDDCTLPPPEIVEAFLNLCDKEAGRIAVHCKAGLGRTGTLIALHMMKNSGFTGRAAIAWLRIVRPGSVIGPQQQYLVDCEKAQWEANFPILDPSQLTDSNADSAALAHQVAQGASTPQALIAQPTVEDLNWLF